MGSASVVMCCMGLSVWERLTVRRAGRFLAIGAVAGLVMASPPALIAFFCRTP